MKILELIDDADIGGGQRHVLLLADGLRRHGIDVSVACAPQGYLVDELRRKTIPVLAVSLANSFRPGQLLKLIRLLRDGGYDILHTHGGTAGLWGRLAAIIAGVPVSIHTYHGFHSAYRKNPLARWILTSIERILLLATSHIICVSQGDYELGKRLRLLKPKKSTVILNGIEVERFSSASGRERIRAEFGSTHSHVLVGTVGRLHVQKGLVYLLEAASVALKRNHSVKFVLVGDGPLKKVLREKAERLGIEDSVHFVGARQDVPDLLAAFDLFVLPSLWEGLPLVLLEASAAGKAMIATAVDGTKEIIQDGVNGMLVPPENPDALAEAILKAASDDAMRNTLGSKAREIAKATYSIERMVEQTMNLYSQVSRTHVAS